jgi:hypothetical protein
MEGEISTVNQTLKSAGATQFIQMDKLITQIHLGSYFGRKKIGDFDFFQLEKL